MKEARKAKLKERDTLTESYKDLTSDETIDGKKDRLLFELVVDIRDALVGIEEQLERIADKK